MADDCRCKGERSMGVRAARARQLAVFFLVSLFAWSASGTSTGNDLLESCQQVVRLADGQKLTEQQHMKAVYCIGYIEGFNESLSISIPMGAKKDVCYPKDGVEIG